MGITESKSWIARILPIIASCLLAFALIFITGCSKNEKSTANEQQSSSSEAASSNSDSDSAKSESNNPNENFTVKDVKVETTGVNAPKITCTVTNNTKFFYRNVRANIEGSFLVKDEYGDEKTNTEYLGVICISNPYFSTGNPLWELCLLPGDNEMTFIPANTNDVVATLHTNKGDDQNFTLEDCKDIKVNVFDGHIAEGEGMTMLRPDEFEVEINTALTDGDNSVSAEITNKTDYKWKSASIYLIAVAKDGSIAVDAGGTSNLSAFLQKPLLATYMKPGTTEQTDSLTYDDYPQFDHFEVVGVIVQKDGA